MSFLVIAFFSCQLFGPTIGDVRRYVRDHINEWGRFDVSIEEIHKLDGQTYQNKYTGVDMHAFEFMAVVKAKSEGYVIVAEDGRVRNLTIFDYDLTEGLKGYFLRYKEVRHITPGDLFEIHNKVIFSKKESGWEAIELRWDLY